LPIIKGWLWFNNAYSGFDCRNLRAWLLESTLTLSAMQLYAWSSALYARGKPISTSSGTLCGVLAVGWAAWGAFIRASCPGDCQDEIPGIWSLVDELLAFGITTCGCEALFRALAAAIRQRRLEVFAHELSFNEGEAGRMEAAEDGPPVVRVESPQKAVVGHLVAGPLHCAPLGQSCAICLQESGAPDESPSSPGQPQQPAWRRTRCGHSFHDKCLMEWLRRDSSCPLCRTDLHEEFGIQAAAQPQGQPDGTRRQMVDLVIASYASGLLEHAIQEVLATEDDDEAGPVIVVDEV